MSNRISYLFPPPKRKRAYGIPDPDWKLPPATPEAVARAEALGRELQRALLAKPITTTMDVDEWRKLDGSHPTDEA